MKEPLTRRFRAHCVAAGFLCLLAVIVAFPVIDFDFLQYEDKVYVVENPLVNGGLSKTAVQRSFTHSPEQNWIPLTWIGFATQVELAGMTPATFRAVSLILHGFAGLLLFFGLARMTQRVWPSLAVTLVWLIHPQRVEVVAWISAQKDLWATVFAISSTAFFYLSLRSEGGRKFLVGAFILLLLSLLSKQSAIALPLVFLLLALREKKSLLCIIPFFALSGVMALLAWQVNRESVTLFAEQEWALHEAALRVPAVYAWQIWRIFWPVGLGLEAASPSSLMGMALAGAALFLLVGLIMVRLGWRHPVSLLLITWIILLLPLSGVIPLPMEFSSDRMNHLPSLTLTLAIFWSSRSRVFAFVLIPFLLSSSFNLSLIWSRDDTLFASLLHDQPHHTVALTNLGTLAHQSGDDDKARAFFHRATQGDRPAFRAWQNLLSLQQQSGDKDLVLVTAENFIAAFPTQADALSLAAKAQLISGAGQDALRNGREAHARRPNSPAIALLVLQAYRAEGDEEGALHFYQSLPLAMQEATKRLATSGHP